MPPCYLHDGLELTIVYAAGDPALPQSPRELPTVMAETELRAEVASLSRELRDRLGASGFDVERLVALAHPLWARARGEATADREERKAAFRELCQTIGIEVTKYMPR